MKYRVTKTEMKKKWGKYLVYVPDGTMQIFRWAIDPVAYSDRVEGWACDYYEFSDFCVNEGYAPVGNKIMTYEELRPYREASDNIMRNYDISNDNRHELIANLLEDFKGDVRRRLGL